MWRVVVVALCGATASPRRLRTQRRTTASGRATIEACDDTIYYTEVTLGGQALQLVVDTGSSDLWVAGKDCNACTQTIYDRDASPTYASDGARVEIAYADGDSVVGVAARDALGWGGVATANQSFVEVDASNFWICGDEDGAAGLVAPVLGIALRDGGAGELWSATLDAVVSREAAAPGEARLAGGVALFDTGTTFLVAPPSDALAVMARSGAACYAYLDGACDIAPCGDLEADAQVDIAVAPCDAAASDAGLAFEFGGASFDLPPEAYVSEQDCGDGEFLDCRGLCWPDEFLEYARDDSCDDGRLGPDLFCVERGCDGGACGADEGRLRPGVSEQRCYVDVDQGREGSGSSATRS
ncbi:aspartic-type endopeptidase [Aureococcus anophagefferens]|uniref:Aspartic-type endopeptidase n=1 Tax=Aureococcus anophagefferens TaxID=44056 RepID=A0ABR1FQA3_AURAN